jgi:hypothetical protein
MHFAATLAGSSPRVVVVALCGRWKRICCCLILCRCSHTLRATSRTVCASWRLKIAPVWPRCFQTRNQPPMWFRLYASLARTNRGGSATWCDRPWQDLSSSERVMYMSICCSHLVPLRRAPLMLHAGCGAAVPGPRSIAMPVGCLAALLAETWLGFVAQLAEGLGEQVLVSNLVPIFARMLQVRRALRPEHCVFYVFSARAWQCR